MPLGDLQEPNGIDSKPPSYDATMSQNPDANPTAPLDATKLPIPNGNPGFVNPFPPASEEPESHSESEDQDFDELQRRFNQLTKRD
ncbi:unnamed protein product [Echinostoma caproni]|uniref:Vps4_C domain-containing protein n=1 Tax=Echinostoma caproni TaxID=27848 RepID=A0A183AL08_9TREM|nr:unnamed protein product [Echinostoma caproni]